MNIKRELIAIAVRLLAERSSVIPKSDPFTETVNALFGFESQEKRIARAVEEDLDKLVAVAKRTSTNVKFKKITKNF